MSNLELDLFLCEFDTLMKSENVYSDYFEFTMQRYVSDFSHTDYNELVSLSLKHGEDLYEFLIKNKTSLRYI